MFTFKKKKIDLAVQIPAELHLREPNYSGLKKFEVKLFG